MITSRSFKALISRCIDLKVNDLRNSVEKKVEALLELSNRTNIPLRDIAFIGDDLPDLPVILRVGYSIAVANANNELLKIVKLVTKSVGGKRAVREVAELILKIRGILGLLTKRFIK